MVVVEFHFANPAPLPKNDHLGSCTSEIKFENVTSTYKMLVQYGRLETSPQCFKATIGKSCNLPSKCNSVSYHHLSIDNKVILICIGYLGDTLALRTLKFYPLANVISVIPQDLYFVTVEKLNKDFDHAILLPEYLIKAFVHHPSNLYEFFIDKDFNVCKRGDILSAVAPFLRRRLTVNSGLIQKLVIDPKHVPFVCKTTKQYNCIDNQLHLSENFKKGTCRAHLIINTTHALCSHAWVQYPDKLCPTDYKYRTGMYTYPEMCTSISESDGSKPKTEGNWLTQALVAVVDWLFRAAEKVIDFLESCLGLIVERLGVFIYNQLLTVENTFEEWDEQFLLFELLIINFVIVYRSNSTAAILFTLIFGILIGYSREKMGSSFRILTLFRSIPYSTLF